MDEYDADQVTMNKIDTYLVDCIHNNKFQNIDFDRDASKSDIKDPSFLEHSIWDQRVTNKHAYSDNDHGRGIKAQSSLELPSQLQIVQFLVERRQRLSHNGCQDLVIELIQSFQAGEMDIHLLVLPLNLLLHSTEEIILN